MNNVQTLFSRIVNVVQEINEHGSKNMAERPATARRHQDLRRDLLEAAAAAIEAEGLAGVRARDLARAVGCSVGAIYNVFNELDELILLVNAATLAGIDRHMHGIREAGPAAQLLALAAAYLDYAVANRRRWDALFSYSGPAERVLPDWFAQAQNAAFSHIDGPLAQLRPDIQGPARALLSRSIFSAVHGIVALGLDKRVAPIELPVLRAQLALVVRALIAGLPAL
jgi:AcrR family transcriptional regulator